MKNKFNMNQLWDELHRIGSEMGFSWLNNHQATYFWKPINSSSACFLAKSTERKKWDTGEESCWFWLEGNSKSSNYKNAGQNEVYWCISESQQIVVSWLVLWNAKKNKCWDWSWVKSAYTFYGFSYFFRRQTLRGGREMKLRKGDIYSQQQPNIQKSRKKTFW